MRKSFPFSLAGKGLIAFHLANIGTWSPTMTRVTNSLLRGIADQTISRAWLCLLTDDGFVRHLRRAGDLRTMMARSRNPASSWIPLRR
jgi:hypothetical protein